MSNQRGQLPEGVVRVQGDKPYASWPYTLDTAHQKNQSPLVRFLGITSEIIQIPTQGNDNTAIVKAQARWMNADGDLVVFDGIGDASPRNVKANLSTVLLRFADTRAKGRALRDSVNIGEVLEEELAPDDEPLQRTSQQPTQRSAQQATSQAAQAPKQGQSIAAYIAGRVADYEAKNSQGRKTPANAKQLKLLGEKQKDWNLPDTDWTALLVAISPDQDIRDSESHARAVLAWSSTEAAQAQARQIINEVLPPV